MFKPVKFAMAPCLAVVLAACGGGSDTAQVKDTLIVAHGSDAQTLDPHYTNDQPSSRVSVQIYSQLVEVDQDMNLMPGLATSWEQINDTTTQFRLREGVLFHNGEELKASDVKFTFERMIASPTVAHIVDAIEAVEVVDDYTVNVMTSEPFGPLLYHLSHTAASILSEKAVTEAGEDYGQHPVGTGPYQFIDWSVGDRITMEAFDDYYGGKQEIQNLVYRNITEGTNRAIALETGEIDVAYDIEAIDKSTIIDKSGLELIEEESLSQTFISFNTRKAPLDNKKVRQAIGYSINADDIVEAVVLGAGRPANSPIGPKVSGHNPNAKLYSQNYEKARELLAEAGYPDGFTTSMWVSDSPVAVQMAQVIQAQLRQVGILMAIEVVEWGAFLDGTNRGEHDMLMMGWVTVTGDADYGLYALFSSNTHGGAGNRSFYSNERVDELLRAGRISSDHEERRMIYAELQEILQDELPIFSTHYTFQNVGVQSNVKGFQLAPTGHHRVRGVHFEG